MDEIYYVDEELLDVQLIDSAVLVNVHILIDFDFDFITFHVSSRRSHNNNNKFGLIDFLYYPSGRSVYILVFFRNFWLARSSFYQGVD